MYLILDTSVQNILRLGLADPERMCAHREYESNLHDSENMLARITDFLQEEKTTLEKLSGIIVSVGPGGSFTGVRLGVVIANTLAWSLNIPNVGVETPEPKTLEEIYIEGKKKIQKKNKPSVLLPNYGREPNITKPKKK